MVKVIDLWLMAGIRMFRQAKAIKVEVVMRGMVYGGGM